MKDVKIRDKRNKDWFRLDNEYLNGYAKIFGAVGTAIYVSLCRHADNETQACFPSMEQMARELGISRKTVWTYIKRFEQHNLILREEQKRQEGSKRFQNCTYFLLDKSEWKKHPEEGSREYQLHTEAVGNGYTTPCVNDDTSREYQLHSNNTHKNNTHLNKTNTSPIGEGASPVSEVPVTVEKSSDSIPDFAEPLPPSSATPPSKPSYGNADVNAVLDYLRAVIGLTDFAEPVSEQRKWATHIARLGKAIGSEEFQKRLQALLDDPFKRKKLNKTAGIYYEIKGFIPSKDLTIPTF